jgi:hypothetical protein
MSRFEGTGVLLTGLYPTRRFPMAGGAVGADPLVTVVFIESPMQPGCR